MHKIVQPLEYSDAPRLHFVALSNRSLHFLTDISRAFFQIANVVCTVSELNFVTSNYLNSVLDVTPDCALNGGKDELCVNHRPERGLVRMRTSSSDGGESFAESQGSLRMANAEGFYLRFSKHACRSGSEINSSHVCAS